MQQMINPIKILTSGVEKKAVIPFFAGNRWRFSDRTSRWEAYNDAPPVVIGHYWRLFNPGLVSDTARYRQLFNNIDPVSWQGKHRTVFCVDFFFGGRCPDRKGGRTNPQHALRM